jgi:hypothetical protein
MVTLGHLRNNYHMDLIDSATTLRKRMGDYLTTIKRLDPRHMERLVAGALKRDLVKHYKSICACCSADKDIQGAHIVPVAIGGRTEENNLILLCKQCHGLYDAGHLSINRMLSIAQRWRRNSSSPLSPSPILPQDKPFPTMTDPPQSVMRISDDLLELQREREYPKAMKLIERWLSNPQICETGRIYLQIKKAELTRRRSGQGKITRALRFLKEIAPETIPQQYRPVFYYELSYIYRLRGEHASAAHASRQSAQASQAISGPLKPDMHFVAAASTEILCEMATSETLPQHRAREFENKLCQLQEMATQHGGYWDGRWALNCATYILQVRMKSDDRRGSWTALKRLQALHCESDVSTGWDAGGRQMASLLDGLVHVLFGRRNTDVDRGIGLLARAFITRMDPRQRFEGIRDVGFGLVNGLRRSVNHDMDAIANHVECLMRQTVDGTSVLWPWRAPKTTR